MKQMAIRRAVGLLGLIVLVTPLAQVSAGQAKGGITGDWQVKADYDGRQITSILSLSNDAEGKLKGEWISFFGLTELTDIKYEGENLSFVQTSRFGDQERKTKFTGTIQKGKLSGTLSSDRGEYKAEGTRVPRIPGAVGNWETKLKTGDRESTAVLAIKANEKGKLSADWKGQSGEDQITKVQFKGNKLSFVRKSKAQDQQGESTFEGTIKGQTLTGVMKSGQGETSVEGKRIGAAAIGRWELEIASDSGSRRQLLKINPDLSAMYGPLPIEKINLDSDKIAFKTSVQFGDQSYEISFAGQIAGNKITGEITTSRGTQKVTGKKRAQTPGKQQAAQVQETTHEPDVIYVPTPQEVVD